MNKGFTLIETIVYLSLFSIVMFGIFIIINNDLNFKLNKRDFSIENYEMLIKNFHEN